MKSYRLLQPLLALFLTTAAYSATADWTLINAESSLNFLSTKKLTIGEVHSFKQLSGALKENGEAQVTVTLSSLETLIPKRNERMKNELFETAIFPNATVKTKLDMTRINSLKVGESYISISELMLSIHGKQQEVEASLRITVLANNKLLASTISPIIINASAFDLVKGIKILQTLAKLPSISTAIPVTANFIFTK